MSNAEKMRKLASAFAKAHSARAYFKSLDLCSHKNSYFIPLLSIEVGLEKKLTEIDFYEFFYFLLQNQFLVDQEFVYRRLPVNTSIDLFSFRIFQNSIYVEGKNLS